MSEHVTSSADAPEHAVGTPGRRTDGQDADTDAPESVAADVLALDDPTLVVFDCDGVLAPLVAHADDSVLLDGVRELLGELARTSPLDVAVLSGRSLDGLVQFDFPADVLVVGSYGGERRDHVAQPLDDVETVRLAELEAIATAALETAGDGAWIERKPASVVLHVFEADDERGERALAEMAEAQPAVDGSHAHTGHMVFELMARPTDKGAAIEGLRADHRPASIVYLGDDVPDEDAFATLGSGDLGIKVGPGSTAADRRLADPAAVRDFLRALAASSASA